VEGRADTALRQVFNQRLALSQVGSEEIVDMSIMRAVLGAMGTDQAARLFQVSQSLVICAPQLHTRGLYYILPLELAVQKCRSELGGRIRRAYAYPSVFIHHTAQELLAIGALLMDDIGPINKFSPVYSQCAPFARNQVLCLVERKTA